MKRATRDQLCTSFSANNPPVLQVQPGESFVMASMTVSPRMKGPTLLLRRWPYSRRWRVQSTSRGLNRAIHSRLKCSMGLCL